MNIFGKMSIGLPSAVVLISFVFKICSSGLATAQVCPSPDGIYAIREDCTSFLRCEGGNSRVVPCPRNLSFNPHKLTCDYTTEDNCIGKTRSSNPVTESLETNEYKCPGEGSSIFPSRNSCSEYYRCVNGTAYKERCPTGLLMNKQVLTCDYEEEVPCDVFRQRKLLQDDDTYDNDDEIDDQVAEATASSVSEESKSNDHPKISDAGNVEKKEDESHSNAETNDPVNVEANEDESDNDPESSDTVNVEEIEDETDNDPESSDTVNVEDEDKANNDPGDKDTVNVQENEVIGLTDILMPTVSSHINTYETTSEVLSLTEKMKTSVPEITESKTVKSEGNIFHTKNVDEVNSNSPSLQSEKYPISSTLSYDKTVTYSPNSSPKSVTTTATQEKTTVTESMYSSKDTHDTTSLETGNEQYQNITNARESENTSDNLVTGNGLKLNTPAASESSEITNLEYTTEVLSLKTTDRPSPISLAQSNFTTESLLTSSHEVSVINTSSINAIEESYDIVSDAEPTSEILTVKKIDSSTEFSQQLTTYKQLSSSLNSTLFAPNATTDISKANPITTTLPYTAVITSNKTNETVLEVHEDVKTITKENPIQSAFTESFQDYTSEKRELLNNSMEHNEISTSTYKSSSISTEGSLASVSTSTNNSETIFNEDQTSHLETTTKYFTDSFKTTKFKNHENSSETTNEKLLSSLKMSTIQESFLINLTTRAEKVLNESTTLSQGQIITKDISSTEKELNTGIITVTEEQPFSVGTMTEKQLVKTYTTEDNPNNVVTESSQEKRVVITSTTDKHPISVETTTIDEQLNNEMTKVTDGPPSNIDTITTVEKPNTGPTPKSLEYLSTVRATLSNKQAISVNSTTTEEQPFSVGTMTEKQLVKTDTTEENPNNVVTVSSQEKRVVITTTTDKHPIRGETTTIDEQLNNEITKVTDGPPSNIETITTVENPNTGSTPKILEYLSTVRATLSNKQVSVNSTTTEQQTTVDTTLITKHPNYAVTASTNNHPSSRMIPTTENSKGDSDTIMTEIQEKTLEIVTTEEKPLSIPITEAEEQTKETENTTIAERATSFKSTSIEYISNNEEHGTEMSISNTTKIMETTPRDEEITRLKIPTTDDATVTTSTVLDTVFPTTFEEAPRSEAENEENFSYLRSTILNDGLSSPSMTVLEKELLTSPSTTEKEIITTQSTKRELPSEQSIIVDESVIVTEENHSNVGAGTNKEGFSSAATATIFDEETSVTALTTEKSPISYLGTTIKTQLDRTSSQATKQDKVGATSAVIENTPTNLAIAMVEEHSNTLPISVTDVSSVSVSTITTKQKPYNKLGLTTEEQPTIMLLTSTQNQPGNVFRTTTENQPNVKNTRMSSTNDEVPRLMDVVTKEIYVSTATPTAAEKYLSSVQHFSTDDYSSSTITVHTEEFETSADTSISKESNQSIITTVKDPSSVRTTKKYQQQSNIDTTLREEHPGVIYTTATEKYLNSILTTMSEKHPNSTAQNDTSNKETLTTENDSSTLGFAKTAKYSYDNDTVTSEYHSNFVPTENALSSLITTENDKYTRTMTSNLTETYPSSIDAATTEIQPSDFGTSSQELTSSAPLTEFEVQWSNVSETWTMEEQRSTKTSVNTEQPNRIDNATTDEYPLSIYSTLTEEELNTLTTVIVEKELNRIDITITEEHPGDISNARTDTYQSTINAIVTEKYLGKLDTTTDVYPNTTDASRNVKNASSTHIIDEKYPSSDTITPKGYLLVTTTHGQNYQTFSSETEDQSSTLSTKTTEDQNILEITATEKQLSSVETIATEKYPTSMGIIDDYPSSIDSSRTEGYGSSTDNITIKKYPSINTITSEKYLINSVASTQENTNIPSFEADNLISKRSTTTIGNDLSSVKTTESVEELNDIDITTAGKYSLSVDTSKKYPSSIGTSTEKYPSSMDTTTDKYSKTIDVITDKYTSIMDVITDKYTSTMDTTTKKHSNIMDNTGKYSRVMDITTDNISRIRDTTTDKYPSIRDTTTDKYSSIMDRTTEKNPNTMDITADEYSSIMDTTEKYPSIVDTTTKKYPSIVDTTTEKYPGIKDAATGKYPSIIDTTTDKYSNIMDTSTEKYSSIMNSTTEKYSSIIDSTTDKYSSNMDSISAKYPIIFDTTSDPSYAANYRTEKHSSSIDAITTHNYYKTTDAIFSDDYLISLATAADTQNDSTLSQEPEDQPSGTATTVSEQVLISKRTTESDERLSNIDTTTAEKYTKNIHITAEEYPTDFGTTTDKYPSRMDASKASNIRTIATQKYPNNIDLITTEKYASSIDFTSNEKYLFSLVTATEEQNSSISSETEDHLSSMFTTKAEKEKSGIISTITENQFSSLDDVSEEYIPSSYNTTTEKQASSITTIGENDLNSTQNISSEERLSSRLSFTAQPSSATIQEEESSATITRVTIQEESSATTTRATIQEESRATTTTTETLISNVAFSTTEFPNNMTSSNEQQVITSRIKMTEEEFNSTSTAFETEVYSTESTLTSVSPRGSRIENSTNFDFPYAIKMHSAVSEITSMKPELRDDQTVNYCNDGDGIFADSNDCSKYVQCLNGLPYFQSCPDGLYFNTRKRTCDYEKDCDSEAGLPTSRNTEISCTCENCLMPDAENCTRYYICLNSNGYDFQCSDGLHFNPEILSCDYERNVTCAKSSVECPIPNGYIKDSTNCSRYFHCVGGIAYQKTCNNGHHFNRVTNQCEDPCLAGCDSNGCIAASTLFPSPICDGRNGFYPHPENCDTFYRCSNGKAEIAFCPDGEHFSPAASMCLEVCEALCDHSLDCFKNTVGSTKDSAEINATTAKVTSTYAESTTNLVSTSPVFESTRYETTDQSPATDQPLTNESKTNTVTTTEVIGTESILTTISDVSSEDSSILLTELTSLQPTTISSVCEIPDGIYPKPGDCSSFYVCASGIPTEEKCDRHLHFSQTTLKCEFPCHARCDLTIDCSTTPVPDLSTHQPLRLCKQRDLLPGRQCYQYINCTSGIPFTRRCPLGLHFNPTTRVCDWPKNAGCGKLGGLPEVDNYYNCPCENCLVPFEDNCVKYHLCIRYVAYTSMCSTGLLFDYNLNTCNKASKVYCERDITTTLPTTTTISYTTASTTVRTTTPAEIFKCPRREGYFQKPNDCGRFIQCANWRPYDLKCPSTLHFSMTTLRCEYPCDAKCDFNLACLAPSQPSKIDQVCTCLNCKLKDPESCTKYIECKNGKARAILCRPGQTFDSERGVCDWAHRVKCHSQTCPKLNGLFPYEGDCQKFIHCANGIPYINKCHHILEFDPVSSRCSWPSGRCGLTTPLPPTLKPDDKSQKGFDCPKVFGFYQDENNCNRFYHCSHGIPFVRECPQGLVFNPKHQVCDWKENVKCDFKKQYYQRRCRVYDRHATCPQSRVNIQHSNCDMFYDCSSGSGCAKRCPVGLYFNAKTAVCDRPENVQCIKGKNEVYSLKEFAITCYAKGIGYMTDPSLGHCFYRCHHEKVLRGCCPRNAVFNVEKEKCEIYRRRLFS